VALRRTDPTVAERWRVDVREALTTAMARGATVIGMSRDGDYLLKDSE
jgi:predicted GNAT superfamily acetyltransferase